MATGAVNVCSCGGCTSMAWLPTLKARTPEGFSSAVAAVWGVVAVAVPALTSYRSHKRGARRDGEGRREEEEAVRVKEGQRVGRGAKKSQKGNHNHADARQTQQGVPWRRQGFGPQTF